VKLQERRRCVAIQPNGRPDAPTLVHDTKGKEAMNPNLLARLNDEHPASRYTTAWVLDEFGVPTRRVGGNIGDEATPAPAKR
jgi:hypothetical protein